MNLPKISIITPSFNQGNYLEETILSVLNQNYPNLEYIIIDGGSNDQSAAIIKKYEFHLKYWVSEKDRGQAHALNKGLNHCTGEIFNWINSDDYLEKGALLKVADIFNKSNCDVVAGTVANFDEAGNVKMVTNRKLHIEEYLKKDVELIYHQPGVWLKMENIKCLSNFNEKVDLVFDQEFMMRYLLKFNQVVYLPDILAHFRLHPDSKTVSQVTGYASDFRKMYKLFWKSQNDKIFRKKGRRKFLDYEWPLLNMSINSRERSRLINFSIAVKEILRDPQYRFNKDSIGWLKHILLGPRNESGK